ncbi:MAG: XRE family transcriptional regulator [Chloroflexota bacterium]|nr:MAG: XRE family transcriptional regulator [Chloroflexota bacterium]
MTTHTGRAFNEWLRVQLKAKKMSQRQLAQQSGVDHSTISRLIRGDRMPSLGTATALARGLREIRDDSDTAQYLGLVTSGSQNPTARIEYALRADDALGEAQVRQVMEYYLAVRMRRFGRVFHGDEGSGNTTTPQGGSREPAGSGAGGGGRSASGRGPERPDDGRKDGTVRIEPLPAGSRPLGYAHLPPRSAGINQPGGLATRVTTTSTITRPPGRSTDRY